MSSPHMNFTCRLSCVRLFWLQKCKNASLKAAVLLNAAFQSKPSDSKAICNQHCCSLERKSVRAEPLQSYSPQKKRNKKKQINT